MTRETQVAFAVGMITYQVGWIVGWLTGRWAQRRQE